MQNFGSAKHSHARITQCAVGALTWAYDQPHPASRWHGRGCAVSSRLFGLGLLCRTTACSGLCGESSCPECTGGGRLLSFRCLYGHSAACLGLCCRAFHTWLVTCAGPALLKWGRHCDGAECGLCCGDASVCGRGLAQLRCVVPQLLLQVMRPSLYM